MRVKILVILCVALLLAVFPASAAASTAHPSGGFWHLIRWGETLASISRMYGVPMSSIAGVNGLVNINRIWAGTYLYIPTAYHPPPPPPGPTCRTKVTVRRGDTLADIAWAYGVSVWKLAEANCIGNINLIYPGQRLCIPWAGLPR
jgi:LysM repeat protein